MYIDQKNTGTELFLHDELTKLSYSPELGLFPARINEISSPRLKAWLYKRRVWNVETNGNHEQMAIGTNIIMPIPAS